MMSFQLFTESSIAYLDITLQLSFLEGQLSGPGKAQPGAPAKKRRVESGWGVIREAVTAQANPYMAIPWYKFPHYLLGTVTYGSP